VRLFGFIVRIYHDARSPELKVTMNISIQDPQKVALLEQTFQCVHSDVV